MVDTSDADREEAGARRPAMGVVMSDLQDWFVREVLPLEAALTKFLQHNRRNGTDVADLLQDVYLRIYDSACRQLPESTKSFVFATAHNLLVDRVRREKVVPLEMVENLEALGIAAEIPGPDENVIAREELRRVQAALDHLPARSREAVLLRQVEGLSRREIAARMGITEKTVKWHLNTGVRALADILYSDTAEPRTSS